MTLKIEYLADDFLRFAKLSKATYAAPIRQQYHGYSGQRIIHGTFGRGFCRILWNDREVAIAFRGTREKVQDFLYTNLRASLTRPGGFPFQVHRGFELALRAPNLRRGRAPEEVDSTPALTCILQHVDSLIREGRSLYLTGHSLGGALATLAAAYLCAEYASTRFAEVIQGVFTYGQPAVGGRAFHDFYGPLHERTYRLMHGADVVPFSPPFPPYRHVGTPIWIDRDDVHYGVAWPQRLLSLVRRGRLHLGLAEHSIQLYIKALERIRRRFPLDVSTTS